MTNVDELRLFILENANILYPMDEAPLGSMGGKVATYMKHGVLNKALSNVGKTSAVAKPKFAGKATAALQRMRAGA